MDDATPFAPLYPDYTCAVYDPADGSVVHVHHFTGDGFSDVDRSDMALEAVRALRRELTSSEMRVISVPVGFDLTAGFVRLDENGEPIVRPTKSQS